MRCSLGAVEMMKWNWCQIRGQPSMPLKLPSTQPLLLELMYCYSPHSRSFAVNTMDCIGRLDCSGAGYDGYSCRSHSHYSQCWTVCIGHAGTGSVLGMAAGTSAGTCNLLGRL